MIPVFNPKCNLTQRGTGISDCYTELGIPDGFINSDIDWSIALASGTLDAAYILGEIKKGNFVPFNNALEFSPNNEEDVYKTYNTGQKKRVRKGLIEQSFTYSNGRAWHAAAASNDHNGTKSAILIWKSGHIGFDSTPDGKEIKGLRVSHQTTAPFSDNDGQNPGETMIMMQLVDTNAYNQNLLIVSEEDLGVDFSEVFAGALDSFIEVQGTPAASDTTIQVKVSPFANRNAFIAGITDFQVSGQTVSGATYDAATKTYTITVDSLTAGDKTISLGVSGDVAAEVSGKLYSGNTSISVS